MQYKYWHDAIFYLIEDQTYDVIALAVGVFVLTIWLSLIRSRFLPVLDKRWVWVCLGSIVTISSATVLNYHDNVRRYEAGEYYPRRLAAISELRRSVSSAPLIPEPPIDFEYTDDATIEKMYSQLGPSLVEEKRTTEASGREGARAELGGGAAKLEGHAERENKIESVQERIKSSTERKCIELMHYTYEHRSLHTYSDDSAWIQDRISNDLMHKLTEDAELLNPDAPITERAIERLRIEEPVPTTPADMEKQGRKDIEKLQATLDSELTNLKGSVLITGVFTVRVNSDHSLALSHVFATKPRGILFEASAPRSAKLSELISKRKLSLTILGTVTTPLSDDGKIGLRAIAIY